MKKESVDWRKWWRRRLPNNHTYTLYFICYVKLIFVHRIYWFVLRWYCYLVAVSHLLHLTSGVAANMLWPISTARLQQQVTIGVCVRASVATVALVVNCVNRLLCCRMFYCNCCLKAPVSTLPEDWFRKVTRNLSKFLLRHKKECSVFYSGSKKEQLGTFPS